MMRMVQAIIATAGAALLLLAIPVRAESLVWDFRVFLNDAPIGYHRFSLTGQGEARELKSEARFEVKFLFVTAYRYVHDAAEDWRGNCMVKLEARTDDNGQHSLVEAVSSGDGVVVATKTTHERLPGCVMSFAYWNPQILRQSRLLNAQTGEYEMVNVAALGEQTISVRGVAVAAKHYRLTGPKHPIDLWYSTADEWLALESSLSGGRRLRYSLN